MPDRHALLMAGIPQTNAALLHRIRFSVGDPAAYIQLFEDDQPTRSILILRDIEVQRGKQKARADEVTCPAEYSPPGGLSGDRETATAQAAAECIRQAGATHVVADRSLPLIYAEMLSRAGVPYQCDLEMGVVTRRSKDEQECQWLREAQQVTEAAMRMACQTVANAEADRSGVLIVDGTPLTAERLRAEIDIFLIRQGYRNPPSIVAGGPVGADCHNSGSGPLKTAQPVIIDIFPMCQATHYNGDCTRTVVHGDVSAELQRMHAAVQAAKEAAIAATKAGVTGQQVHQAATGVIRQHGYQLGLPADDEPDSYCGMVHGTGHGIGLDVHEPPLLDQKGPELVVGDALTIEPGLYSRAVGGVRIEDMVIVTDEGCENLNSLPEGLDWR